MYILMLLSKHNIIYCSSKTEQMLRRARFIQLDSGPDVMELYNAYDLL